MGPLADELFARLGMLTAASAAIVALLNVLHPHLLP
jgi:hypothetical protein